MVCSQASAAPIADINEGLTVRAESRKFPRHAYRTWALARIHPPKGREEEPLQVCFVPTRDISRGGINFLHPTPLFQSQRIDLEMTDGRKFELEIRWVRRLKRNNYLIGCRFAEIDQ